jgi:hypothetical protein
MDFCLLSSFILFSTKKARYLMVFWCMFFISFLMLDFGMFSLVRFSMECSCMAPPVGSSYSHYKDLGVLFDKKLTNHCQLSCQLGDPDSVT